MRHIVISAENQLRLLEWLVFSVAIGALGLAVLGQFIDGFETNGVPGLLAASLSISVAQVVIWPLAYRLFGWLPALIFPVIIFAAAGFSILAAAALDNALQTDLFEVHGLRTGIWIAMGLAAMTTIGSSLFSLDDAGAYDRFVTEPLRIRFRRDGDLASPGFLFLEIDGLAGPVLERAIKRGYMPTLSRWLNDDSHRLMVWEPDLSSQTSASQAGILLGSNDNVPAFRWWDKQRGQLMVSSWMSTAKALEESLASGIGLLEPEGASRFNVFSGGASDCVGTFSRLSLGESPSGYWAYFANPYSLARTLSLFAQDVVREWWEGARQRWQNVLPRVSRSWRYAFIRAGTTAIQLELVRFMAIADLFKGVPAAYYTLFAYDEVAHHTGIDRGYTFKVLRQIDRMIGHLERVARDAPRPFHIVVLSDHGQSQGATFRQCHGRSLSEVVLDLLPAESNMTAILDSEEHFAQFEAMLTESVSGKSRSARATSRLLQRRTRDGVVVLGGERSERAITSDEIVVLASGNLGLISFTRWPERMTLQEITNAFPGLIEGLIQHPGIGLVLVHDQSDGPIVFGHTGTHFLASSRVEGRDPLQPYGSRAADHLRRTSAFPACPDVLVISAFSADDGAVAAFEELVGSHGGLGGTQQMPFVLHPAGLDAGEGRHVGAASLNRLFRAWIAASGQDEDRNIPSEGRREEMSERDPLDY